MKVSVHAELLDTVSDVGLASVGLCRQVGVALLRACLRGGAREGRFLGHVRVELLQQLAHASGIVVKRNLWLGEALVDIPPHVAPSFQLLVVEVVPFELSPAHWGQLQVLAPHRLHPE